MNRFLQGWVTTVHPIQCRCGAVKGQLESNNTHNRLICHCTDCRAFARFLSNPSAVLDKQGGTEIVQIAQRHLRFLQGEELLSAVRLSDKGMLRWYTTCYSTPIGNTMADPKVSFIGLVHACLDRERMDRDFGAEIAVLNTDTALGNPQPKQRGLLGVIARFIWIVVTNRIGGGYRKSPLFDASGVPRVVPRVLKPEELASLKVDA